MRSFLANNMESEEKSATPLARPPPNEKSVHVRGEDEHVVFVLTSNVDGFFRRVGFSAVSEIHGTIHRWQCGGVPNQTSRFPLLHRERCSEQLFPAPACLEDMEFNPSTLELLSDFPRCPKKCGGGLLRPNVYLFGDGSRFVVDEAVVNGTGYAEFCQRVVDNVGENRNVCVTKKKGEDGNSNKSSSTSDNTTNLRQGREGGARLVILEIGCGLRVPNIRKRTEELFLKCGGRSAGAGAVDSTGARVGGRSAGAVDSTARVGEEDGGAPPAAPDDQQLQQEELHRTSQVDLIRINPEYETNAIVANPSIAIRGGALEVLGKINTQWRKLKERSRT